MSKLVLKSSLGGIGNLESSIVTLASPSVSNNVNLILPSNSGVIALAGQSKVYNVYDSYTENDNVFLKVQNDEFTKTALTDGFRLIIKIKDDISVEGTSSIYLDFFDATDPGVSYKLFCDNVSVKKVFANTYLDVILSYVSSSATYQWNVISSKVDSLPASVVTSVSAVAFDASKYDLLKIGSAVRPPVGAETEGQTIEWCVPIAKVDGTIPKALVSTDDPRLTNARDPKSHTHSFTEIKNASDITLEQTLENLDAKKANAYWVDEAKTIQTLAPDFLIDCGTL